MSSMYPISADALQFHFNRAFILIVSPTLAKIITASVTKPAVYPIVPEKVSRMTAKEAPPSTYPMILVG